MSTLTDEQVKTLLGKCRAYLHITWTDESADEQIKDSIRASASYLETVYGSDLMFTDTDDVTPGAADYLARELLLHRVFYDREKALDDFDGNFVSQLNMLANMGKVKQSESAETSEG